jgi:hypothetical protein
MQPHQERVVMEKKELDDKLSKLRLFFTNNIYSTLDLDEQERLRRQEDAMHNYSEVLGERIHAFQ